MTDDRTWTTTLTGKGATPRDALDALLADPLAERINEAIYLRAEQGPAETLEQLARRETLPIAGWTARCEVKRRGRIEEPVEEPTTLGGLFQNTLDASANESLRLVREIIDAIQRTFPPPADQARPNVAP